MKAEVVNNAPLKNLCTYKLSGVAKCVAYPGDIAELKEVLSCSDKYKVIGNGSNLIFLGNYDGTLIKLSKFDQIYIDDNIVRVGAGYNLPKLSLKVASVGLAGLEFASGIPATIGGAVYMNAGAYKSQMSDVLIDITILDENGEIRKLDVSELDFHYRKSILQEKKWICLEATLKLEHGDRDELLEIIKDRRDRRVLAQPLNYPSAGSVFRNPDGDYAGRLIESVGLKGKCIGDAQISEKHANFIINTNAASGKDVKELIDLVQTTIKKEYDIDLILEQEIVE